MVLVFFLLLNVDGCFAIVPVVVINNALCSINQLVFKITIRHNPYLFSTRGVLYCIAYCILTSFPKEGIVSVRLATIFHFDDFSIFGMMQLSYTEIAGPLTDGKFVIAVGSTWRVPSLIRIGTIARSQSNIPSIDAFKARSSRSGSDHELSIAQVHKGPFLVDVVVLTFDNEHGIVLAITRNPMAVITGPITGVTVVVARHAKFFKFIVDFLPVVTLFPIHGNAKGTAKTQG